MKHNVTHTPRTLQECFDIIDDTLPREDKRAIMAACEFELEYAFHDGLRQWVNTHIVERYGLRGEDFFIATDLWSEMLLLDNPSKLSSLILVEYRRHLHKTSPSH